MRSLRLHARGARFALGVCLAAMASPSAAAAAPPAAPDPAVELASRARSAYERGDFRAAIDLYRKARELRPDATLLFNLARCYEALAALPDLKESVASYEAYLRERPDSSDRAAVERRVEALEQQIRLLEERSQPKPVIVVAPPPELPAPPKHTPVPWVLTGVGAGGVLAGVVLGVLAQGRRDDAVAEPSGALAAGLEREGRSLATGANIAFIAGGALMLAGTAWGIVDLARPAAPPRPVAVSVGLGTLQLSLRF